MRNFAQTKSNIMLVIKNSLSVNSGRNGTKIDPKQAYEKMEKYLKENYAEQAQINWDNDILNVSGISSLELHSMLLEMEKIGINYEISRPVQIRIK